MKDTATNLTWILTKREMTMLKQIMFQASTDKQTTKEIRDFAWNMHKEIYNIYTEAIAIQFNRYKRKGE